MTDYTHLIYEVDADHICWLTLNRPEKLNAMNLKLIGELQAGLERADADDDVNVIVIQGAVGGSAPGMTWTRTPPRTARRSTNTARIISSSSTSSPPPGGSPSR